MHIIATESILYVLYPSTWCLTNFVGHLKIIISFIYDTHYLVQKRKDMNNVLFEFDLTAKL